MTRFCLSLLVLVSFSAAARADETALVAALLDLPGPVRSWRAHLGWTWPEDQPPPDDAPIEALKEYWEILRPFSRRQVYPSRVVAQRLKAAGFDNPDLQLKPRPQLAGETDAAYMARLLDAFSESANAALRQALADDPPRWLAATAVAIREGTDAGTIFRMLEDAAEASQGDNKPDLPDAVYEGLWRLVLPRLNDDVCDSDLPMRLVEILASRPVEDAIPYLHCLLDPARDEFEFATLAMARLGEPVQTGTLRRGLQKHGRHVETLALLGDFSPREIADGIVQYARMHVAERDNPYAWVRWDNDLDLAAQQELIGFHYAPGHQSSWVLAQATPPDESIRLLGVQLSLPERLGQEVVQTLHEWLAEWHTPAADRLLIEFAAEGRLTGQPLAAVLRDRTRLLASAPDAVRQLQDRAGAAAILAVVIRDDANAAEAVLRGGSAAEKTMLLAAARQTRLPLPLDAIEPLLTHNEPRLALAARLYLEAIDTAQSRRLVWRHAEDKPHVITNIAAEIERLRSQRQRLLDDPSVTHLFASWDGGNGADQPAQWTRLIFRGDAGEVEVENEWRVLHRPLAGDEAAALLAFFRSPKLEDLPATDDGFDPRSATDGFLWMTRDGGLYRPKHYNPLGYYTIYGELERRFQHVIQREPMEAHYHAAAETPKLRVLHSNLAQPIDRVWADGDDVRVKLDADDSWRRFEGGRLGEEVQEPPLPEVNRRESRHRSPRGYRHVTALPQRGEIVLEGWGKVYNYNKGPPFLLMDIETGATRPLEGDVWPWRQVRHGRMLQATANPAVLWAAHSVADGDHEPHTVVGRYDTRTFTFAPVATFPRLAFESAQMWVDERRGVIYVVDHGVLLTLPLSP